MTEAGCTSRLSASALVEADSSLSVSAYTATGDGTLLGGTSLDISADSPAVGGGLYYVVMPLGCGSWQTSPGAEPGRDAGLP